MRVEFEFYDEEPLENIITCLNYQMDKVVFFKYKNQSQMPLNNRIMKEKSEREQRQKDNLRCLGVRRMHKTVEVEKTPVTEGQVAKIAHLVKVEEIED